MAKKVITSATLIWADVDISAEGRDVAFESSCENLNVTNYASGGWEEMLGGIKRGDITLQAFLNDTAEPDETFFNVEVAPFFLAPERPPVAGNLAFAMYAQRTKQNRKYQVGQVAAIDLAFTSNSGPVMRGVTLYHNAALAGTANGTAFQRGAVSASQRAYATLHVKSITGTTPTLDVTVESDNDSGFPSATTRITFDQVTDVSAAATRYQYMSVAGAITDDWWRGVLTVSGTGVAIDLTLFLAIAP